MVWCQWLWMMACVPSVVPDQPDGPRRAEGDTGSYMQTHAIIATVASDYSVGALAAVGLGDWDVSDTLVPISGDPVVVVDDGWVIQLNRFNHDTVRLYEPGVWSAPVLDLALVDGANPHDAAVCGDVLWISQYGQSDLSLIDLSSGLVAGAVDLSAYADSDGLPEMSDMVEIDGVLYVALQRLNRDDGWVGDTGAIVAIDCTTRAIDSVWETGPSPNLSPLSGGRLLVRTGLVGPLDGAVRIFDPSTGDMGSALVSEEDLGRDLMGVASREDQALVTSASPEWDFFVGCLDVSSGAYQSGPQTAAYLASASLNDRGEAWIAARPGWSDADAPVGTLVVDLASCSSVMGADRIHTLLPPFSIGFYP